MKGVILAAGFGTRLWPLTEDRTKPAIPFLNRPLIAYGVEYLVSHGFDDIIINLHHQPESVRDAVGDGSAFGARVTYSQEEEILGTSGALDRVRHLLTDDDFAVINGKLVTSIDLGAVLGHHRQRGAVATLVLRPNAARERFSMVNIGEGGKVLGFSGYPEPLEDTSDLSSREATRHAGAEANPAPLMFTGIQIMSPRILDYVPRGRFSHSTVDVYPKAIATGELVLAYISEADWFEMSTLDRYLEASVTFLHKQDKTFCAGADTAIADGSTVIDSVLWSHVSVEQGATVIHSVIGDNVTVAAGMTIKNAVVVRRDLVTNIERGEIVGDNLIVPLKPVKTS